VKNKESEKYCFLKIYQRPLAGVPLNLFPPPSSEFPYLSPFRIGHPSSKPPLLTIFENTKQVIQDYDSVFDNSIPFRKNDLLRITYFKIQGVPGLHFVPWHRGSWCPGRCRRPGHRGGRRRV